MNLFKFNLGVPTTEGSAWQQLLDTLDTAKPPAIPASSGNPYSFEDGEQMQFTDQGLQPMALPEPTPAPAYDAIWGDLTATPQPQPVDPIEQRWQAFDQGGPAALGPVSPQAWAEQQATDARVAAMEPGGGFLPTGDIPYLAPVSRFAGDVLGRGTKVYGAGLSGSVDTGDVAPALNPIPEDWSMAPLLALEAIPGIGFAPDAVRLARGGARAAIRAGMPEPSPSTFSAGIPPLGGDLKGQVRRAADEPAPAPGLPLRETAAPVPEQAPAGAGQYFGSPDAPDAMFLAENPGYGFTQGKGMHLIDQPSLGVQQQADALGSTTTTGTPPAGPAATPPASQAPPAAQGGGSPPPPPAAPPPGGTMSEGDAVMALRSALREGKGQERIDIVAQGRKRQAARITGELDIQAEGGASGLDLARRAGAAGAGKILPEGGIGFKLADDAIDPLIDKALRLSKEGQLSPFEAIYGVAKALDEGRRLGPTPAQAKLLSKLTGLDEADFAPYVRQRKVFDVASKERIAAELATVGQDAPAALRTQLQAQKRQELLADRAEQLGKPEQAAKYRAKAEEHKAKAAEIQKSVDEKERIAEIRKLGQQIAAEVKRQDDAGMALTRQKDAALKQQAKIQEMVNRKTQREIEAAQAAFDRAQEMSPVQAAKQEQEISRRLISQLQPPNTDPARIRQNSIDGIRKLNEAGITSEQTRTALEVLDYWEKGNRAILDSVKNSEGLRGVVAGINATVTGDLADSHLTSLMYRSFGLGHALTEAGLDPALVKKVTNQALNYELKLRYGDNVPQRIFNELEKMKAAPYSESLAGIDLFVQRAKNTMFSIDAGVFGVQVRTAIRRGGINTMAGLINKTLGALHMPHVQTHMNDVALPKRLRNIVDGVHVGMGQSPLEPGAGTVLSYGGPAGRALDDKLIGPVLDRINRLQFGNVMGWVGDNAYEGNLVMLHLLRRDITNPAVRATAAGISNSIKSFANKALRAGRHSGERMLLTSPAMTRSQMTNILQMSKVFRPGATAEERILGATLIASQAVYYLTVGKFLNDQIGITDFVFQPGQSGFGTITTEMKDKNGRNTVIDMFPQASLEKAIGDSFLEIAKGNVSEADDPWFRYFSGRASMAGRAVTGFGGIGYSGSRGFVKDLSARERLLSVAPLPPIIQSLLAEGFDPIRASLDAIGVSSWAESDSIRRTREQNTLAQEQFGAPYRELFEDQQRQVDAADSVAPWVEGARQQQAERGSALAQNSITVENLRTEKGKTAELIDQRLASGQMTGQEARAEYDRLEREVATEAARLANTPEAKAAIAEIEKNRKDMTAAEQAQADYYRIFDRPGIYDELGNFNFEEYQRGLQDWQAAHPGVRKEQVSPAKPLSAGHAELENARQNIGESGWWDAYDQGYQLTKQASPEFAALAGNYRTYDEWKAAMVTAARAAGLRDQDQIEDAIFQISNRAGLTKAINFAQAYTLKNNQDIIPHLLKWYDLDPGELRVLAGMMGVTP